LRPLDKLERQRVELVVVPKALLKVLRMVLRVVQ
jgi:hypothetical protein